ncbi:methyltransferase [Streptomyces daliensis]
MQLASSFWAFKTLAAAVELELFTFLRDGRQATVKEVAEELGIHGRPADMFLAACASLGLLEKEGDGYRNSAVAEELLVAGRPRFFGGYVRFLSHREYPAWHDLTTALRENRPLTWDPENQESIFSAEDPVMMELFWEAMHSLSTSTAQVLAGTYDFGGHRRLLDIGGGSGAFPLEVCATYPGLSATVFDLPHVCPIAAEKIRQAGLDGAIDTVAGDFLADEPLPAGHDVAVLSMILHDWDESTGRALLRKCWEALEPGGVVLVVEWLLNPERTGPPAAALMGMNMIVETVGGQNYSEAEYADWLTDAGFREARVMRFDAMGANGAMVARKPR